MSLPPRNGDDLEIWTVCKNPSDFPGMFTARRWFIRPGEQVADPAVIVAPEIDSIRKAMMAAGKYCLPRQKCDPPVVVECWI